MKKVEIDLQLVEAIAQYLSTRPWGEVNGIMVGLHRAVNGPMGESHSVSTDKSEPEK